jgi:hypothetical protein
LALGELVEESRGKTTSKRVLDVDPPKVVTSFKMEGNFKETLCTETGSYTAVLGEGGILQGEGYGIITSKDGQVMNKLKPSFYLSRLCMMFMAFKCKECGLKFEEKRRLDIHKQVHGRKPKISEYGSPEFNQGRLRG